MEENIKEETITQPISIQPKKRSNLLRYFLISLVIVFLSFTSGFVGASLFNKKNSTNTTVIYQTIEKDDYINPNQESNVVSNIAIKNDCSVVAITTQSVSYSIFMQSYISSGAGSGVVFTSDGYIVTCYHVVENATLIEVTFNDGMTYPAELVGFDEDNDIAVVKIDIQNLKPVVLGDSSKLFVGETVVSIGNPLGTLGGTVTDGIVSALEREITFEDGKTMSLIQTNAAVNPGNSGGALFNEFGELVGVVNAKSSGSGIEGLGFAIPINTIKDNIVEIIEKGYVTGKRRLGLEVTAISNKYAAYSGYEKGGFYITKVEKNSLGEAAGFKVRDRLISINEINIDSIDNLNNIYINIQKGSIVRFRVERDNQEIIISFEKE